MAQNNTGKDVFQGGEPKNSTSPKGGNMDYTNVKKGSYTNDGKNANVLDFKEYQRQNELISKAGSKNTKRTSIGKDVVNENNKKLLEDFTRFLSENKIQSVDEQTIVEFLKNNDSEGESEE